MTGRGGRREGAGRPKIDHKARAAVGTSSLLDHNFRNSRVEKERQEAEDRVAAERARRAEQNELTRREQVRQQEKDRREIEATLADVAAEAVTYDEDTDDPYPEDFDFDVNEDEDDDASWSTDDESDSGSVDDGDREAVNATAGCKRNVQTTKPTKGTPLFEYMETFKDRVLTGDLVERIEQGQCWFYPERDASTSYMEQPTPNPRAFACTDHVVIYVHLPHRQKRKAYNTAVLKEIACFDPTCAGHMESHQLEWRLGHGPGGRSVWILHRRVRCHLQDECACKNSSKYQTTIAEIDPRFLHLVDTRIVQRFPFITTVRGAAVHRDLVYQYLDLAPSSLSMGTYVKAYNKSKKRQYWEDSESYYTHAMHWVETRSEIFSSRLPQPFPAFSSNGVYNGALLPLSLFKHVVIRVLTQMEPYLQTNFQLWASDGAVADASFKFAKTIKHPLQAGGGTVFNCSYTVLSKEGMINANRMMMTKANSELEFLLEQNKASRENAGVPKLKRLELDGGTDIFAWNKVHPELKDGVEPYEPIRPPSNVAFASLSSDNYQYIESVEAANILATRIQARVNEVLEEATIPSIVVGTDTENNCQINESRIPRVLQLCFPVEVYSKVLVFHLFAMDVTSDHGTFPKNLKDLLQHPQLVHCGVNIGFDHDQLQSLGVKLERMVDLRDLAVQADPVSFPAANKGGMDKYAASFLGVGVDKSLRENQDWTRPKLTPDQIRYAALDALVSLQLYWAMYKRLEVHPANGLRKAPHNLKVGEITQFVHRGNKKAANVKIIFVGGTPGAETRKWGKTKISTAAALVELVEPPKCPGVRAPYPFKAAQSDIDKRHFSWTGSVTIMDIWEKREDVKPQFLVPLGRLTKRLSTPSLLDFGFQSSDAPLATAPAQKASNTAAAAATTTAVATAAAETAPTPEALVPVARAPIDDRMQLNQQETSASEDTQIDYLNEDSDPLRSRDKRDIFHKFNELPIRNSEPMRVHFTRLLIHASLQFDREGFQDMAQYLGRKFGIEGVDELLDHFYFHRELWRKHVKMFTPTADHHGDRIYRVRQFVKGIPELSKLYDGNVDKYFEDFEAQCRQGKFAEMSDTDVYLFKGVAPNGLNEWFRLRGTTRAENVHQKQGGAVGPWGIGARFAHFLLLWTDFNYNVSTGINRLNHHDFGHSHLQIVDRVQVIMMRLYGVDPFPRHANTTLFEGCSSFTPVGIGPLWSEDPTNPCPFVEIGPPDERLTGSDLRFMAERMRVKCPPLHISTQEERKLFASLVKHKHKVTQSDLASFAEEFRLKTDCKTIFPKLPSMLKLYYDTYQKNTKIRVLQKKLGTEYSDLLKDLARPVDGLAAVDSIQRQSQIRPELPQQHNSPVDTESVDIGSVQLSSMQFAAPTQQQVIWAPEVAPTARASWQCRNPYCNKSISECGGFLPIRCKYQGGKRPRSEEEEEEAKTTRRDEQLERKRQRMAAKRKKEKEEKKARREGGG